MRLEDLQRNAEDDVKDARYLLGRLKEVVEETESSLDDGRTEHYRGDAAELRTRATELSARLIGMAQAAEAVET